MCRLRSTSCARRSAADAGAARRTLDLRTAAVSRRSSGSVETASRSASTVGRSGPVGSGRVPSQRTRLSRMTLELATAGESHGPALVAILSGLPAGLVLDRAAIDADLRRRQQGYGRSPRQQIETDEVEVLAGLRHGRTLGTPLALVVRNRDHRNWTWGMSPWPPEGEPEGKGTKPVTLPRPGHADLAGRAEVRARRRPRRARARLGAAHRRPRRRRRGREGAARARSGSRSRARRCPRRAPTRPPSTRREPTATRSAASSRCARAACRPGLGSYARARGPARRPARRGADGDPGRQGRRGRRRVRARAAARLRGARRDRPRRAGPPPRRRTAPAASRAACRTARRSSCARR